MKHLNTLVSLLEDIDLILKEEQRVIQDEVNNMKVYNSLCEEFSKHPHKVKEAREKAAQDIINKTFPELELGD